MLRVRRLPRQDARADGDARAVDVCAIGHTDDARAHGASVDGCADDSRAVDACAIILTDCDALSDLCE